MTWQMIKDCIFLNLNYYFEDFDFPINLFILAITIGACIATICVTAHKRYTVALLRGLIRHNAFDESSAVTLQKLHISPSLLMKNALLRHSQLTDMVSFVSSKNKITANNLHEVGLYVKPDRSDRARRISEGLTPSYISSIIACYFFLVISIVIVILMPEILSLLSGVK